MLEILKGIHESTFKDHVCKIEEGQLLHILTSRIILPSSPSGTLFLSKVIGDCN